MWQTPPESTWQARQQRLDWLELAMSDAKEMFQGLKRHWNLLERQNRIAEAVDIMKVQSRPCSSSLFKAYPLSPTYTIYTLMGVSPKQAVAICEGAHFA